jgi:uncharacterized protein
MKQLAILASALLVSAGAQAVSMPGFCAKGIGAAEAKICAHPGSTESEGLVFALYRAALEKLDAGKSKDLQEQHTKWWDGVKKCADSQQMGSCISNAYGSRMLQLQNDYKLVKTTGPVNYTCADKSTFRATFFDTTPKSMVALRGDQHLLLRGEASGSGIAYGNRQDEFKEHQGKITLKWGANAKELSCKKA